MNEILTELSKPVWWVSVVLAGIAINLLSAYLKKPLDGAFASTSSWWRRRSEARKLEWEERIAHIASNDENKSVAAASEVRLRLQSIHLLLLAIFMMLLPLFISDAGSPMPRLLAIFILAASSIILFQSFRAFQAAVATKNALHEARRRLTL